MALKRSVISAGLAAAGMLVIAQGFWIPIKAIAAQAFLNYAWVETLERGAPQKPWPWADTWPVARLTFDALGESLIVLEGANAAALAFGPGRMINSVYPNNPNTVIAGHRDTHFADLKAVKVGQLLTYQASDGSVQSFEVIDTRIVHETQTGVLEPTTEPTLTLITCYPFDAIAPGGPLRYVVRAQLDVPDYSLSSSARLARVFKEALEMSSRAQF